MKNFLSNKVNGILLLTLTIFLASCGSQKPMVSDVQVTPETIDNELYLSVTADLSIGNVTLPQTQIPIYNPKTWEEIGSVSMGAVLGGKNRLGIDLNVSAISNLNAGVATLPNGSSLPLIADNPTISIPIDRGIEVYVTIGNGVLAIGSAIPIKSFDGMGAKVGTSNLFPIFNIEGVLGAAGIFTSKNAGQNGIGFFADVSSLLDDVDFVNLKQAPAPSAFAAMPSGRSAKRVMTPRVVELPQVRLNYNSQVPSSSKEKKLNRELYRMHKRKQKLKVH